VRALPPAPLFAWGERGREGRRRCREAEERWRGEGAVTGREAEQDGPGQAEGDKIIAAARGIFLFYLGFFFSGSD
jgi:hypothetical protein